MLVGGRRLSVSWGFAMRASEVAFRLPPHIAEQFSDEIREEMLRDAESCGRWGDEEGAWAGHFVKNNAERMEESERVRAMMIEHIPSDWTSSRDVWRILADRVKGRKMTRETVSYHMTAMKRDGRVQMKKELKKCYWRRCQ